MSQSDMKINRGHHRALADLANPTDRQDDAERLLRQVADVCGRAEMGEMVALTINGAHGAGFQICVVIEPGGRMGWSLR